MPLVSNELLEKLYSRPNNIRNFCIVAHVDHGKTTLADSLIASNGIISSALAGKLRYLDFEKQEIERQITMKSSSISLLYARKIEDKTTPYLINLVDSPGHADFIGEVETAVRVLDGCLVVVDCVEGVCIQTHAVLRQAWKMKLKPCLVLNKIDRLVNQLGMTPIEAYEHLKKIIQQVNAVQGTFVAEEAMENDLLRFEASQLAEDNAKNAQKSDDNDEEKEHVDELYHVDIGDDSEQYFSPHNQNVIFASGIDGWAFRIEQFADLSAAKLGMKKDVLLKVLWEDFYYDRKLKKVTKKQPNDTAVPLFVQIVLNAIWNVYKGDGDEGRLAHIAKALQLPPDRSSERSAAKNLLRRWLPLSDAVLSVVVDELPSPKAAQIERTSLMFEDVGDDEELQTVLKSISNCDASDEAPLVVYVSKVFAVTPDALPQTKKEKFERRPYQRRQAALRELSATTTATSSTATSSPDDNDATSSSDSTIDHNDSKLFVCLARVLSGTLRPGMEVRVLGPKYSDLKEEDEASESEPTTHHYIIPGSKAPTATVDAVYMPMGRVLESLSFAPAGSVCAIGGLAPTVLKSAILTNARCPPLRNSSAVSASAAVVRVSIEPEHAAEHAALATGLRLLNNADAAVDVYVEESGETILQCAGELHLARCVEDLRRRFCKGIQFSISKPLVPMRESIIDTPRRRTTTALERTASRLVSVQVDSLRVPQALAECLERHSAVWQRLFDNNLRLLAGERRRVACAAAATDLRATLAAVGWTVFENRIWALGPRRVGTCLLLDGRRSANSHSPRSLLALLDEGAESENEQFAQRFFAKQQEQSNSSSESNSNASGDTIESLLKAAMSTVDVQQLEEDEEETEIDEGDKWWRSLPRMEKDEENTLISTLIDSVVSGFQLATAGGPLCDEPMTSVAFVIGDLTALQAPPDHVDTSGPLGGQLASAMRRACREAFLARSPRLHEPMYLCDIQITTDYLGKAYEVLGQRRAKVLSESLKQGTPIFSIRAMLPMVTSFGFSETLMKRTSGAASVQLVFAKFCCLDADPLYKPETAEEKAEHDKSVPGLVAPDTAKLIVDATRRRKGLTINEQLVESAEKQRTLSRTK